MIEPLNQDDSTPIHDLELSYIFKETFQQFWSDESATYSCNFMMMGIVASGMIILAGWLPV